MTLPEGSYKDTCKNYRCDDSGNLIATCKLAGGDWGVNDASIAPNACNTNLKWANSDGNLIEEVEE